MSHKFFAAKENNMNFAENSHILGLSPEIKFSLAGKICSSPLSECVYSWDLDLFAGITEGSTVVLAQRNNLHNSLKEETNETTLFQDPKIEKGSIQEKTACFMGESEDASSAALIALEEDIAGIRWRCAFNLLVLTKEGTLYEFDLQQKSRETRFLGEHRYTTMEYADGLVYTGTSKGGIDVWDKSHKTPVMSITFKHERISPPINNMLIENDLLYCSVGNTGKIVVWDRRNPKKCLNVCKLSNGPVTGMAIKNKILYGITPGHLYRISGDLCYNEKIYTLDPGGFYWNCPVTHNIKFCGGAMVWNKGEELFIKNDEGYVVKYTINKMINFNFTKDGEILIYGESGCILIGKIVERMGIIKQI
ncbi:hypothetical protein ENBRE01_2393 [Enteropsectra breve]|nr:hypothetical protein ENBRE01_2393 [Enteropsectra breve]